MVREGYLLYLSGSRVFIVPDYDEIINSEEVGSLYLVDTVTPSVTLPWSTKSRPETSDYLNPNARSRERVVRT